MVDGHKDDRAGHISSQATLAAETVRLHYAWHGTNNGCEIRMEREDVVVISYYGFIPQILDLGVRAKLGLHSRSL